MDSEHRHELKRNELAQIIANAPEYIKKNQKAIIYVAVVAILVIVSAYMTIYRKQAEDLQSRSNISISMVKFGQAKQAIARNAAGTEELSARFSTAASKLIGDAENLSNDLLKALAYIKAADIQRIELLYKSGTPEKAIIESQINLAMSNYNKAIDLAKNDINITAIAKIGIALCQEELGNFDQAKAIYAELANEEKYAVSPASAQAEARLNTIDDYKNKVTFLPALPKTESKILESELGIDGASILEGLNVVPADSNK